MWYRPTDFVQDNPRETNPRQRWQQPGVGWAVIMSMLFEDDERYVVPSTCSSSFQMGADQFQHDLKIVLRTRLLSPSNSRRWYFRYATGGCAYVYARASVDGLTRKLEWDSGSGGCGTPEKKSGCFSLYEVRCCDLVLLGWYYANEGSASQSVENRKSNFVCFMESPWNGEAQLRRQMLCKITCGKTVAGGWDSSLMDNGS